MTVRDLIAALCLMPQDAQVHVNLDEEFIPIITVRESNPSGIVIIELN